MLVGLPITLVSVEKEVNSNGLFWTKIPPIRIVPVPDAPSNIKVVALSPTALVVSWMPPDRPNGRLTSYTVYSRVLEGGREKDSAKRRLPPTHTNYEVHELRKGEAYEFWVTGFTREGEGQSTQVIYATISNRGRRYMHTFLIYLCI